MNDSEPETVDCPKCSGSGFSGYGTGYDDVCGWCIAGKVLKGEYESKSPKPTN